jgi:probable HAF family extracellular repeat protein
MRGEPPPITMINMTIMTAFLFHKYHEKFFRFLITVACVTLATAVQAQKGKPGDGGGTPPALAYTIASFDAPPGYVQPSARGLNNWGHVVGNALSKQGPTFDEQAFLWEPDGTVHLLPHLPGHSRSSASAISDGGVITGTSTSLLPGVSTCAVWWESTGEGWAIGDWNDLLPVELAHTHFDRASALTQDGNFIALTGRNQETGQYATVIGAIIYEEDHVGGLVVLDSLPGVFANNIHHNGSVIRMVGSIDGGGGFLWVKSNDEDAVAVYSTDRTVGAISINGLGQVAGYQQWDISTSRALLWNDELDLWDPQGAIDLGTFGGAFAWARSLNDLGQVVGYANTGGKRSEDLAFLWKEGVLLDLNTLTSTKLVLRRALRINNRGQILVWAQASGASSVHVILTPAGQ